MRSDFDLEGKNKIQKTVYYMRYYGASYTIKKALRKCGIPIPEESDYMIWRRRNSASKRELSRQVERPLASAFSFVIVPELSARTDLAGFQKSSCRKVTEAHVTKETDLSGLLAAHEEAYFVFAGEDICVSPEYLYEVSEVLWKCGQQADLVYTDEDNCVGKQYFRPFFKPDMSPQLLLNFPYLGRCFVVKRSLLETIAASGADVHLFGNGWYDISLQAFRFAGQVCHIPKVLFSNRVKKEDRHHFVRSAGAGHEMCLRRFMHSANLDGTVEKSDVFGFFHIKSRLKQRPLVSIIIPNKDHAEDLRICLNSLKKSIYTDYEVILAENNSSPETLAFYDALARGDERIRTVVWEGEFNYSAINNFAVRHAKGELLLFLNNDTQFQDEYALYELVASVLKPGVGACGAMLYYGDDTIQHAGVIIGMGGFAAHALWSLTDRDEKYYPFSLCEREVSAVTGACLMARRSVYEEVGGMGEDFVVALNDVDFCLKVRAAGYDILFNPYAKLYHYESRSRGYEDTMEKQARFQDEISRLQTKWEMEITAGDPYYNPNLTLHRADYSMDI